VLLGLCYIAYGFYTKFAYEGPCRIIGTMNGVSFALVVRVLPIFLILNKIAGADYSWGEVFIPLWY
jgi:hypothetical protein